jgi:hypothetical protein
MVKLLVRAPVRQRNIRELQWKNLYQDNDKHWHLHFRGSELKVATRRGRVNEYHVDLTKHRPDFIPVLEEFIEKYRPLLPNAETDKHLFLTWRGHPFSPAALRKEIATTVAMRTGKLFYPHLIRTIWTDTSMKATKDVNLTATILGDKPQTVLEYYSDPDEEELHASAGDLIAAQLAPPDTAAKGA